MKYQSQFPVILERLARDGSALNPHATPELCERVRAGEIAYVTQTKTHGGLGPDAHEYIGELLLWEDLWGELPFPGVKPIELQILEQKNPGIRTLARFKLSIEREEAFERRTDAIFQSTADQALPIPEVILSPKIVDQPPVKSAKCSPSLAPGSSMQWANSSAEKNHRTFNGSMLQRRGNSAHRRDWAGPSLGWDTSTGLPNYAVMIEKGEAYLSVCGLTGIYAAVVDKNWRPDFRLEYQRLIDDHSLVVWPEPITRSAARSTSLQNRAGHLAKFLRYWSRKLGKGQVPINEAWYDWVENPDSEDHAKLKSDQRSERIRDDLPHQEEEKFPLTFASEAGESRKAADLPDRQTVDQYYKANREADREVARLSKVAHHDKLSGELPRTSISFTLKGKTHSTRRQLRRR